MGWFYSLYGIWTAEQNGKAELANAEYSKRVTVETAKAKKDSATFEADTEVARAEGVGKEEYLRYLYITNLAEGQNREVIYIPTEAGIPILEANRFVSGGQKGLIGEFF